MGFCRRQEQSDSGGGACSQLSKLRWLHRFCRGSEMTYQIAGHAVIEIGLLGWLVDAEPTALAFRCACSLVFRTPCAITIKQNIRFRQSFRCRGSRVFKMEIEMFIFIYFLSPFGILSFSTNEVACKFHNS